MPPPDISWWASGPMLWLICQITVRQLVTPRR